MTAGRPIVGLVVPPAAGAVPPEAAAMHPDIVFHASGLGLKEMTPEGYAGVIDRVGAHAERLAQDGAQAVALMGTSLSFFRGSGFNADLIAEMRSRSGVPATTMSQAIVDELKARGARRIVAVTAYRGKVNDLLTAFLRDHGIGVERLLPLDMTSLSAVAGVPPERLSQRCFDAVRGARTVDGILISCGGLRTLDTIAEVEAATGLPVVTSATAGVTAAVGLLNRRTIGRNGEPADSALPPRSR